jgi:DNA-binding NtrC family response regulator
MTLHHRALVVDDDRTMVKTLADVLRMKGWEVTSAYSGAEAVEAASRTRFDVVLMDIKMPGMDGVEAFKAIKARQPDVKVVLMTAYAAQDLIQEAEREGVMRVLPKPVNLPMLLELMGRSARDLQPILLIDNDAAFLRTLSDVLRLRGYETIIADSLDAAMRLMETRRPLAVLLHMHLSSATTLDAVFAVREGSPGAALILYSGKAGAVDELEQLLPEQLVYRYLQKPFAVEEVTGVLDAVRNQS